jgi:hypothetical protein
MQKQREQHNANGACHLAGIRYPPNFAAADAALIRVERDDLSYMTDMVDTSIPLSEEQNGEKVSSHPPIDVAKLTGITKATCQE